MHARIPSISFCATLRPCFSAEISKQMKAFSTTIHRRKDFQTILHFQSRRVKFYHILSDERTLNNLETPNFKPDMELPEVMDAKIMTNMGTREHFQTFFN
jgi:hypothetical protein